MHMVGAVCGYGGCHEYRLWLHNVDMDHLGCHEHSSLSFFPAVAVGILRGFPEPFKSLVTTKSLLFLLGLLDASLSFTNRVEKQFSILKS